VKRAIFAESARRRKTRREGGNLFLSKAEKWSRKMTNRPEWKIIGTVEKQGKGGQAADPQMEGGGQNIGKGGKGPCVSSLTRLFANTWDDVGRKKSGTRCRGE